MDSKFYAAAVLDKYANIKKLRVYLIGGEGIEGLVRLAGKSNNEHTHIQQLALKSLALLCSFGDEYQVNEKVILWTASCMK